MLTLPPSTRIFVATAPTDMRKQFDGLISLASVVLKQDPLSGHVFAFCNRRRDRVKLLFFDRTGYWIFAKRLERGTFAWPSVDTQTSSITWNADDLMLMLSGVDPSRVKRRRWWSLPSNNLGENISVVAK